MRKNPYEKIRRALFILLVVMLVTAACVMGVMLIKHTHNAEKKIKSGKPRQGQKMQQKKKKKN